MTTPAGKPTRIRRGMRLPTEAEVKCRPYSSIRGTADSRGVMLNVSENGSYVVTRRAFEPGSFLVVRTTRYPHVRFPEAAEGGFRSIFLAEVKWRKEIKSDTASRYGVGLKYLD
ncbi:hypothetical protein DSCA_05860 [Desulfosarcina alkanivorans]|uniref:PilZ domain-containing protein n=2 Tax=Desulfosarcina alkanivorans TaxID=571177 RepID=A0A5K7YCI6_9BACT|nr:hypothetical protein DSCA_05860 [Desulfosarcina alkanivorans]